MPRKLEHRLAVQYAQRESLRQQAREQAIVAILEVDRGSGSYGEDLRFFVHEIPGRPIASG